MRTSKKSLNVRLQGLAKALLERDGNHTRAFENLILALIVISVVSVGLEALPQLPNWARQALWIEEIVVVAVFSSEYLLRLATARRKLAFVFSFYGLADLV